MSTEISMFTLYKKFADDCIPGASGKQGLLPKSADASFRSLKFLGELQTSNIVKWKENI